MINIISTSPGDIGGYMGLLIGASAMTLCELLDLIIYNLAVKCLRGTKRKQHSEKHDPAMAPINDVDQLPPVEKNQDKVTKVDMFARRSLSYSWL